MVSHIPEKAPHVHENAHRVAAPHAWRLCSPDSMCSHATRTGVHARGAVWRRRFLPATRGVAVAEHSTLEAAMNHARPGTGPAGQMQRSSSSSRSSQFASTTRGDAPASANLGTSEQRSTPRPTSPFSAIPNDESNSAQAFAGHLKRCERSSGSM
eukprot:jgi/Ulvmu1/4262/UM194_0002.1